MKSSSVVGRRIACIGSTTSGKTTLAGQLGALLDVPAVDLDGLIWEPGWREAHVDVFRDRIRHALAGDGWVTSGNYIGDAQDLIWPRLDTVIYLDMSIPLLVRRVLTRSWGRRGVLLWGTNYETFWPHLKVWSRDSLIYFALTTTRRRRRQFEEWQRDPRWAHIRFHRLRSPKEVARFVDTVEKSITETTA
ncbi:MAG: adenylate kinase [Dehalococcoidia bacterium]|nr:MAG: adenylate kinase [Dehalococcoidia bacterium]